MFPICIFRWVINGMFQSFSFINSCFVFEDLKIFTPSGFRECNSYFLCAYSFKYLDAYYHCNMFARLPFIWFNYAMLTIVSQWRKFFSYSRKYMKWVLPYQVRIWLIRWAVPKRHRCDILAITSWKAMNPIFFTAVKAIKFSL